MSLEATLYVWKLTKEIISATEKLVLLSFADRANEYFEAYPSQQRLVSDTCLDLKTIKKALTSLLAKGILIQTGEHKGRSKQIPVYKFLHVKGREFEDSTPPKNGLRTQSKNGLGTPPKNGLRNLSVNLPVEPLTNDAPKEASKSAINHEALKHMPFQIFMSAYPKHKEYWKKAFKHFKADIGRDKDKLEKVLANIAYRLKHDKAWIGGFIPAPASYLENRMYDIEIIDNEKTQKDAKQARVDEANRLKAEREALQDKKAFSLEEQQYMDRQMARVGDRRPKGMKELLASVGR